MPRTGIPGAGEALSHEVHAVLGQELTMLELDARPTSEAMAPASTWLVPGLPRERLSAFLSGPPPERTRGAVLARARRDGNILETEVVASFCRHAAGSATRVLGVRHEARAPR